MNVAVSVENLNYAYPRNKKALENVNLEVFEGEKVAVIGPNGAGKTTFFLHLNGTIKSPEKNVKIFGKSIGDMAITERIREVGIVFADPDDQLFMPTVFDDIAFGPTNMGLSREEVEKRVKYAIECVGLEGLENRVPHHLSCGQKKKVALAAVIAMHPRVIVLDEPTANLDPKSRSDLIRVINELNEKEGITVIIAMHDVNVLAEIADRVYVLNREIVAEGSPREIFSDFNLLRENKLDAPDVFKLFKVLSCFGYNCDNLPLCIDEAVNEVINSIERDGHIHLHMHEHTHSAVKEIMNNYSSVWM
ncbi:ATPase component NikO of energizing module of nickel ECF transporter [Methanosarcina sp. MTP4]|uniref:energy-coupling factor ABC transporter ATP-binding protein n=1 Tax=Methanosarcina sp. MTP4 TaxID=1434100 RepID=UPI000615F979|nr:ABC transporter ATP-binding protein [Methanosarcina sp. MTP4]AKB24268.1 ATPase component NikO of energizing module of nickel ECF transporter [Methanosarcina sp. MTP4]